MLTNKGVKNTILLNIAVLGYFAVQERSSVCHKISLIAGRIIRKKRSAQKVREII